jgi:predicted MPP superfamily phosphohydrolase
MRWYPLLIIVLIVLFLFELYFLKKIKHSLSTLFPSKGLKVYKVSKIILLVTINLYPLLLLTAWTYTNITGNRIPTPENVLFDYLILYPFWISLLLLLQNVIYYFIIDIIKLLILPVFKKYKEKLLSFQAKLVFLLLVFFTLYVPARIIFDYNVISTRIVEYKKKDLPKSLENFRLTFISDMQADRYTDQSRLQHFINDVNATMPDLVLMGGDMITSTPEYIEESGEFVGKLKSKFGVYSCVGDHDNWAYRNDTKRSLKEVMASLKKHGVQMIDDGKKKIVVGNDSICITFVTNTYVETVSKTILDSLTQNSDDCALKIFLTHQPRQFLVDKAIQKNYDLFLAGHTHGGQITLLFPFLQLSPTRLETKYQRGDFHFGNMLMIVTRGLGMSLAPIRYNSTPEVTLIVLENKK